MAPQETVEETREESKTPDLQNDAAVGSPIPGMVLIFSKSQPVCAPIPLDERGMVQIGRGQVGPVRIDDSSMSRVHARLIRKNGSWTVEDLGSQNGTYVDGDKLDKERVGPALRVVRTGGSLFLLVNDVRPFERGVAHDTSMIKGPTLERVYTMVARAGRTGRVLHVTGESGTGKESVARAFHEASHRKGPFVPVNCATLPETLAERLLFGSRKGAFSGATDAKGFVQAAHEGTLFLDEIGDLDASIQAKLLRVIETGEVLPLGSTKPEQVDVRLCSATHADLRARVAEGRMRADLYFRIGTPSVTIPPLRERPEEIPWLVDRAVRQSAASFFGSSANALLVMPHVSLVEASVLRVWPGNVRELLSEVQQATHLMLDEQDRDPSNVVTSKHLSSRAGTAFVRSSDPIVEPAPAVDPAQTPASPTPPTRDEVIAEALRESGGNVLRAARALNMHRTQIYRWMARQGRNHGGAK